MFFRMQSKHGLLQRVLGQFACIVNFSLGLLFYFTFFLDLYTDAKQSECWIIIYGSEKRR